MEKKCKKEVAFIKPLISFPRKNGFYCWEVSLGRVWVIWREVKLNVLGFLCDENGFWWWQDVCSERYCVILMCLFELIFCRCLCIMLLIGAKKNVWKFFLKMELIIQFKMYFTICFLFCDLCGFSFDWIYLYSIECVCEWKWVWCDVGCVWLVECVWMYWTSLFLIWNDPLIIS